jgi:hypothetical protein
VIFVSLNVHHGLQHNRQMQAADQKSFHIQVNTTGVALYNSKQTYQLTDMLFVILLAGFSALKFYIRKM